ncbi:MAG: MEKHLA domain-containing protein [Nitrospira sp.]|nr:MEKHLA domain-containing protein [Nitrospira sp.]
MKDAPWRDPRIVGWSQLLLDSYRHWLGAELIERTEGAAEQARKLFEVPFVVVSHGAEPDPILNYGNQVALDLWEVSWEQFTTTPSRLTAEADNRPERERMLAQARARGFYDGYKGVRISATGRRFMVEQAVIWTVIDIAGSPVGQAATFSSWKHAAGS